MERLTSMLIVAAGSGLGGALRYLVNVWTQSKGWTAFPWATLIVNIVGCFLIALILTIAASATLRPNLLLFLTTGVMGGLTTYSAFDYETTKLFQIGASVSALVNVGVTLVACFVAGLVGVMVARAVA